jgi:hypothetical protein
MYQEWRDQGWQNSYGNAVVHLDLVLRLMQARNALPCHVALRYYDKQEGPRRASIPGVS